MNFNGYETDGFFDELFLENGEPRPGSRYLIEKLVSLSDEELDRRKQAAELALRNMGITFTVYGEEAGVEKIFPFDIIPRIVEARDWAVIDSGLRQRIQALNLFLSDVYSEGKILKDGVVPKDVIYSSKGFRKECADLKPPRDVWCHISGIDLVRDTDGTFYVLEDNLRCPSGVSYVLENRQVLKRTFPQVFLASRVRPVDDYPARLYETLSRLTDVPRPRVVVLTPGPYNSAYFEHAFLARQMGVSLVQGSDLVVIDDTVAMRTTQGFERVDVIYRRIDDDFIDPEVFREDSMLGVPGLMRAYAKGNVVLANAPGTGVADDKVVYPYVPEIIRYYLSEDPILHNVPTYECWKEADRKEVVSNLEKMVVKAANESGGYGMLIGPKSTAEEREDFAGRIEKDPRNYIGQPVINLSRVPILEEGNLVGRHVDLRPYILYGEDIYILPGGLTRVALKPGSLVVNSSQGGGSKDTWILFDEGENGSAQQQSQTAGVEVV